jgi:hypothetical protein
MPIIPARLRVSGLSFDAGGAVKAGIVSSISRQAYLRATFATGACAVVRSA